MALYFQFLYHTKKQSGHATFRHGKTRSLFILLHLSPLPINLPLKYVKSMSTNHSLKSNLTLIGMPGAGKSTIGIILAKFLAFGFIDTDVLIQTRQQKSLQQIIDESDHLTLRRIEEEEILQINVTNHIIATGGSAVYSQRAMAHLQKISTLIFLEVGYEELTKRIHNFKSRGIACSKGQSFKDLYNERQVLYKRYAEVTINGNDLDQEEIAEKISKMWHPQRIDDGKE